MYMVESSNTEAQQLSMFEESSGTYGDPTDNDELNVAPTPTDDGEFDPDGVDGALFSLPESDQFDALRLERIASAKASIVEARLEKRKAEADEMIEKYAWDTLSPLFAQMLQTNDSSPFDDFPGLSQLENSGHSGEPVRFEWRNEGGYNQPKITIDSIVLEYYSYIDVEGNNVNAVGLVAETAAWEGHDTLRLVYEQDSSGRVFIATEVVGKQDLSDMLRVRKTEAMTDVVASVMVFDPEERVEQLLGE